MTTIILVRHGENEWVKKGRLAGWVTGVHLNKTGKQQARDAATRLAKLPVKAIYSSPVSRCRETAKYIAKRHDLKIDLLEEVGEVRYGQWEGKKIKKLAKKPDWRIVQFFPSQFRFPKGESFLEVQLRAVAALEKLCERHPKEMIVVVSHADVIKLLLAYYLGVHMDLFQRLVISPASLSIVDLPEKGGVRVARINDAGVLSMPASVRKKKKQAADADEEE